MAKGIGIPHPDGKSVRVIMIPESGSDAALTADEQIMLALRDEVERLTAENAKLRTCGIRRGRPHGGTATDARLAER